MRLSFGFLAAALLALCLSRGAVAAPPEVVVSIGPVHSLVAGVMEGLGEPRLLIRGGASPHNFSLRPSDARALAGADLVIWVGEGLETFLRKPLGVLAPDSHVVTLMADPAMTLLPNREAGIWGGSPEGHGEEEAEHHHDEEAEHHHDEGEAEHHGEEEEGPGHHEDEEGAGHHDHGEGAFNPHIWLSPANAAAIVEASTAALAALDPANAARYRENRLRVLARIEAQALDLAAELAPLAGRPYLVFHDAYRYFEDSFGIAPLGSVTLSPERKPGLRRMGELRRSLREAGIVCVFTEPQFEPALVEALVEGTGVKTAVLDPLGAGLLPGPDAYFDLMQDMAAALSGCLAPQG